MATKRSLTVGINNYSVFQPNGSANLSWCASDARKMKRLLRDSFGFTEQYHLADLNASRNNILDTLRHLIRVSEAGDTICFYFSGHGARVRTDLSRADCDSYYECLIPASGGYLTDRDLTDIADDLYPDAVNFTVITDACHSGGMHSSDADLKCRTPRFTRGLLDEIVEFLQTLIPFGICATDHSDLQNNVANVSQSEGVIDLDPDPNKTLVASCKSTLISACHFNELSWESGSIRQGLFTKAIMETITQSNPDTDYHAFIQALQSNVSQRINSLIRNSNRPNVTQTPQLFGQRNRMSERLLEGWIETPLFQ
ncbi:caspase family protein [Nonlabens xiamenensis]|uniref:caspase family protein n=1 Tax=Nonlabens xiamenensis TaxID=2341043 RepID=UPI000F605C46|nr:caspase family protein [Nonlabens xiamenensis]